MRPFNLRCSERKYYHLTKPYSIKQEICAKKESSLNKETRSSFLKYSPQRGKLKAYSERMGTLAEGGLKITSVGTKNSADSFDKDGVLNDTVSDKECCNIPKLSSSADLTSTIDTTCVTDKSSHIIDKAPAKPETKTSNSASLSPTKCAESFEQPRFKKGGGAVKGKRNYRKRTLSGDASNCSPK